MNYNLFIENRARVNENEYLKQVNKNENKILQEKEAQQAQGIKAIRKHVKREGENIGENYKFCPCCQITKELEDFHNNISMNDGKGIFCKPCQIILSNDWTLRNKEKMKAWLKEYRKGKLYHKGQVNFINVIKEALLLA